MKKAIAKVYYDKAKELYPNIKSKRQLMNIAESIKYAINGIYGNYKTNRSISR